MAYIGVSPSNGVRRVHTYTATASQTTFSGAGAEGATLSYKDSNFVDVYQNGVKLGDADYTATSGTSIVLGTGASASDLVVIVVFDVFSVADTVSKADGGTFDGNITMAGTLGVTGALTANAGVVVDNITIDGTEIDLSSGNLTIDVAGQLVINSDSGQVVLQDDTVNWGNLQNSSGDFVIEALGTDKDMIFKGLDGSSTITALTLDMSDAGKATFNNTIDVTGNESDFTASSVNAPSGGNGIINLKAATARSSGFGPYIGFHVPNSTGGTTTEDMGVIGFVSPDSTDGGRKADFIVRTRNTTTGERFRIKADGSVLINTTSTTGHKMTVKSDAGAGSADFVGGSTNGYYAVRVDMPSTNTYGVLFRSNGSNVGDIRVNSSSTAYNTSSDYRLKENLEYSFDATTRLKKLKPCRFNFKTNADTTVDGFIAHEVSDIVPEAITGEKDAMEAETKYTEDDVETQGDNPTKKVGDVKTYSTTEISPQGIDQSKLVPLLTKALQEALTRIDTLEAEVKTLKGE